MQVRRPVVLVGRSNAPSGRQLDVGAVAGSRVPAVDAVREEAVRQVLAVPDELRVGVRARGKRRSTLCVASRHDEVIAGRDERGVDTDAGRNAPAPLVARMASSFGEAQTLL